MIDKKSSLAELVERRIPQILGVYVASVWLAVEVSEWMTERFDVPDQTSSYVFVIMIAFLPLVGLLAWGHGRPGKDKWTQKQLIFIPFNIAIAWFAVNSFIKPEIQATEILSLTDVQTGQVVEYEVAKSGLSQKIAGFFWENTTGDESLDWLSYGAMWMVAKDLTRNPIFSMRTPYESVSMLSDITSKGYERATGEPLSLNLRIANDYDSQWMIKGRIVKEGSKTGFEASLYEVTTGELVTTLSSTYDDWLVALDDLADQLGQVILQKAKIKDTNVIPDIAISQYISSDLEAIESVVNSLNAVNIDNDFERGVQYLEDALSVDENLAEAYVLLMRYYLGLGDVAAAKTAAEAALKLEYNLSQEDVLKVKASYYSINGETVKATKVLENWVKLYPESADALQTLGANYMFVGHRLDDALSVYKKLIELQEVSSTALINLANIYRLKGNLTLAIDTLEIYKLQDPDKARPHLEMANTYLQFSDISAAKMHFEEASLISVNGINADLGLAKIKAFEGDVEGALQDLDQLQTKAQTPSAVVSVLTEKESILFQSGRLKQAMQVLDETQEVSQSFMPPLVQILMYGSKKIAYLAYLNLFDQAWAAYEGMKAEAKPPYDELLEFIAKPLHDLAGDFDKSTESLQRFEAFKLKFQMNVYDQFIFDAKAAEARRAGKFDAAIKLHDQAIDESAQSVMALNSLLVIDGLKYQKALTLYEAERFQECIDVVDQILARNPIYAEVMVLKAKSFFKMSQFDQAKAEVAKAHEIWQQADAGFKELIELEKFEQQLNATENVQ